MPARAVEGVADVERRIGLGDEPPTAATPNRLAWVMRRALIGAAAVVMAGFAWQSNERSGYVEQSGPVVEQPRQQHNGFRMATWNMHNEAEYRYAQLERLARHFKLDAIALQEVTHDDAETLRWRLSDWHQTYVYGDGNQRVLEGGFGNLLLTRAKPRDIKTRSFPGTSTLDTISRTVTGAADDVVEADPDFSQLKDGRQ